MQKEIRLQDRTLEYTLRTSRRARHVRIAVTCDGQCVMTVPVGCEPSFAERFLRQKADWVISKLEHVKQFAGRMLSRAEERKKYETHQEAARMLVSERVSFFQALYGLSCNRISIRNQRTCWGSCSKKGNLNFNYKILFLEKRLADYLVVHELCHLLEFNHSPKFWTLVGQTIPDYRQTRRELKKMSPRLVL